MLPLFHKGSVKNILGIKDQSPYVFDYSNRYSVFDWGAMPDELNEKGVCLSHMADFFFKVMENPIFWRNWEVDQSLLKGLKDPSHYIELKELGLKHHSLGFCDGDGNLQSKGDRFLAVEPVTIITPSFVNGEYGYEDYKRKPNKALVPLEIIFRFGIPEGSSLLNRVNDADYCKSLGLEKAPVSGDEFDIPIIEFSTKLESTDRYISHGEASLMASLNPKEFNRLHDMVFLLSIRLKEIFHKSGLKLWDGKFEFAFSPEKDANGERYFWLVDSIGPDELRLTYDGVQLSKETLRKFYRGSQWFQNIAKAKSMAKERGSGDWKKICVEELNSQPEPLSSKYKEASEMMYKSLTNSLYENHFSKTIFNDAWDMDTLVKNIKGL